MLNPEDAIKIDKVIFNDGNPRTHYFFKCIKCQKSIHYSKSQLKIVTGYCKKCAPQFTHSKPETIESYRICTICEQSLKINSFSKRENGKHHKYQCVQCLNLKKFGINSNDYKELNLLQKGLCAICKKTSKFFNLAVDHDHNTGKIRGLLCENCNRALGLFYDSPEFLINAAKYVEIDRD